MSDGCNELRRASTRVKKSKVPIQTLQRSRIRLMKERLFYWGTVVPLAALCLYVHAEYKDQQAIIDRQLELSNRQLELMAGSYTKLVIKQSELHADEIIKLEQHHRQEVGECIMFYDRVIKETKDKIRQDVTAELTP